MSYRSQFCLAGVPAIALALAVSAAAAPPAKTSPASAPVITGKQSAESARLATYESSSGERYFALSLVPKVSVEPAQAHDVVVLIDTSASQTGVYREDSLAVAKALLAGLAETDRVRLFAVDVTAVPLNSEFVSPASDAAKSALEKLGRRVPLGSTDLGAALQATMNCFSGKPTNPRAAVYIGDGMSKASLVSPGELDELHKGLVARRVAVTSYAIGPQCDVQLLATLANHTGGMVLVDTDRATSTVLGLQLAKYASAPVVWPTSAKYSSAIVEVFPKTAPPLRLDRDSILLGTLNAGGAQQIAMTAEVNGKSVDLSWKVSPEASNDDFAFLPQMLEMIRKDGGKAMPTVGSGGLLEVSRIILAGARDLSKLSSQALASGDREGAKRLSQAALKLDPESTSAAAVRRAAEKAPVEKKKEPAKPAATPKLKDGASLYQKTGQWALNVEEELKLGVKKSEPAPKVERPAVQRPAVQKPAVKKPSVAKPAPGQPADQIPVADEQRAPAVKYASEKPRRLKVSVGKNESSEDAWAEYFSAQVAAGEMELPASIRLTVRELMFEKKYEEAVAMLHGALRGSQAHSWMYDAIALAIQARYVNEPEKGKPELERTLLSGVDFSQSLDEMMFIAKYMSGAGLDERALHLLRKISQAAPQQPECYLLGLDVAKRLDDIAGIQWACAGILGQAWPKEKKQIFENAVRVAEATVLRLTMEQRLDESKQFKAAMNQALIRDCYVVVQWSGDADVDLYMAEPSGTVCSLRNPRSAGGGVMIGDAFSRPGKATTDGYREVYVCPQGFSGEYKLAIKRVWGKATAGKVTVTVVTNSGTEDEKQERQQVSLTDNALVVFNLKNGRRTEPLEDMQVATAAENQVAVSRAILVQQLSAAGSSQATNDYVSGGGNRGGAGGPGGVEGDPRRGRPGVGFRPQITVLPEGVNMTALGVISADRRYVRISVFSPNGLPIFSQIGNVTTFNFASGGMQNGMSGGNMGMMQGGMMGFMGGMGMMGFMGS